MYWRDEVSESVTSPAGRVESPGGTGVALGLWSFPRSPLGWAGALAEEIGDSRSSSLQEVNRSLQLSPDRVAVAG